MKTTLEPSRLAPADMMRASLIGLRTRRLRSILSALGIVIGIAAMVGVLGLSESSKSDLLAQLDRLGTNMLRIEAGSGIGIGTGELPDESQMSVAERAGLLLTRGEYDAALEILKSQAARLQATPRGGHRGEV